MKVYKGTTPVKIYNGNHKMPKIYKGSTLLCSDTNNYHWRVPNMVTNGNFVDATGWLGREGAVAVASNTGTSTLSGTAATGGFYKAITAVPIIGHKYGITIRMRVTNAVCLQLRYYVGDITGNVIQLAPAINTWYQKTLVITADNRSPYIYLYQSYSSKEIASGKVMEVQYVSCVDLTALENDLGITITEEDYEDWISKLQNQYIDQFAMW